MKININTTAGVEQRDIAHAYLINIQDSSRLSYLIIKIDDNKFQEYYLKNIEDNNIHTWNRILSEDNVKNKIEKINQRQQFEFNDLPCDLIKLSINEIIIMFNNRIFNEIKNYERIINLFRDN